MHTLHDHGFSSSALNSISVDDVNESRFISRFIALPLFGEPAFVVVPLLVPLALLYFIFFRRKSEFIVEKKEKKVDGYGVK